jgi:hypothetical protein
MNKNAAYKKTKLYKCDGNEKYRKNACLNQMHVGIQSKTLPLLKATEEQNGGGREGGCNGTVTAVA